MLIVSPGAGFRVSNAAGFSEAPRIDHLGAVNNPGNPFDDVRWGIAWADERLIDGLPGRAAFYRAINPFNLGQFGETWVSDLLRPFEGNGEMAGEPDLAWNGSHLGVIYNDLDSGNGLTYLVFSRLTSTGSAVNRDVDLEFPVNPGEDYSRPRLDNDGSNFGVFWEGNSFEFANAEETFYVEIENDGDLNEDMRIASGEAPLGDVALGDMLTLPGSDYAVVWPHFERGNPNNLDLELYYARLDDNNGIEVSRRLTFTREHALNPQIAFDGGNRIAIVWDEFVEDGDYINVFFMLIDLNGNILKNRFGEDAHYNLSLIEAHGTYATVAWTGESWIVVWQEGDADEEDLIFAVLEPDGTISQEGALLMDPIAPQTALQRPHLAWDGKGQGGWTLGMAFQARHSSTNYEIYFAELWQDRTAWMLR